MNKSIKLRVLSYAAILSSLIFFPWWLTLGFSLVALLYFHRYYEIIFFALIADLVYAVPLDRFYDFTLVCSAAAIILFISAEFFKKQTALYR